MSTFYLCVVPSLILSFGILLHLQALAKHDKVLYNFCQIRRDLMSYLRQNGFEMEQNEYVAARQLIDALNFTIHSYNQHKRGLFNRRNFIRFLRDYENSIERVEVFETNNVRINALQEQAGDALRKAFLAYTPLFRYEVLLKIALFTLGIAVIVGMEKCDELIKQIRETDSLNRRKSHGNHCTI